MRLKRVQCINLRNGITIHFHVSIKPPPFWRPHKSETDVYGHITLKTPVLVRSPKLTNVERGQYVDGWPPRNTACCRFFNCFTWFCLPGINPLPTWTVVAELRVFLLLPISMNNDSIQNNCQRMPNGNRGSHIITASLHVRFAKRRQQTDSMTELTSTFSCQSGLHMDPIRVYAFFGYSIANWRRSLSASSQNQYLQHFIFVVSFQASRSEAATVKRERKTRGFRYKFSNLYFIVRGERVRSPPLP